MTTFSNAHWLYSPWSPHPMHSLRISPYSVSHHAFCPKQSCHNLDFWMVAKFSWIPLISAIICTFNIGEYRLKEKMISPTFLNPNLAILLNGFCFLESSLEPSFDRICVYWGHFSPAEYDPLLLKWLLAFTISHYCQIPLKILADIPMICLCKFSIRSLDK